MTTASILEDELHGKLDLAWEVRVTLSGSSLDDRPEVRVVRVVGELLDWEVEGVHDVERLRAELDAHPLVDPGGLVYRHIHLRDRVQAQIRKVQRRNSRCIKR